jgi:hypothetical protein
MQRDRDRQELASRYFAVDLPSLLVTPAAARKTTPMTREIMPRVERCAAALDAGEVMAPRKLGSDLAGSVKNMMAAMIAKTAMIARMTTAVNFPADLPGAWLTEVISVLLDCRRPSGNLLAQIRSRLAVPREVFAAKGPCGRKYRSAPPQSGTGC